MTDHFAIAIGAGFGNLPAPVRALHSCADQATFAGMAEIDGAAHIPARLLRRLGGFPRPGRTVPVTLTQCTTPDGQVWIRDFGGHITRSHLRLGPKAGQVDETFGPFRVRMALHAQPDGIVLRVAGAAIWGLPLPRILLPRGLSREDVDPQGRFRFDIVGELPLFGTVIRYRGWLEPMPLV
jgi:streptogramin lyase